jgi:histidine triad (HIT) family protein
MDKDCIFCKIAKKEIKANIVYENDLVLAFKDVNPKAPIHVLVIPKKHIEKISELNNENKQIASDLILAANEVAKVTNIFESGYRVIFNCGNDAGQEVLHVHLHVLGGKKLN